MLGQPQAINALKLKTEFLFNYFDSNVKFV